MVDKEKLISDIVEITVDILKKRIAELEEENSLLRMALQFYQVGRVPSVAARDES